MVLLIDVSLVRVQEGQGQGICRVMRGGRLVVLMMLLSGSGLFSGSSCW